MSQVCLIAKLPAAEGKGAELAEAFKAAFEHVNKEDGTRYYILHADAANADVLYVYEMYENQDAANAHMSADWFAPFGKSLAPFMGGRPEMTFLAPIAGKGL
ncbi:MAG: putative quinol monooxygenase [Ilumatobacteraceae bacterium]